MNKISNTLRPEQLNPPAQVCQFMTAHKLWSTCELTDAAGEMLVLAPLMLGVLAVGLPCTLVYDVFQVVYYTIVDLDAVGAKLAKQKAAEAKAERQADLAFAARQQEIETARANEEAKLNYLVVEEPSIEEFTQRMSRLVGDGWLAVGSVEHNEREEVRDNGMYDGMATYRRHTYRQAVQRVPVTT